MKELFDQRVISLDTVFSDSFLDVKNLYLHRFHKLPNVSVIPGINAEKACSLVVEKYQELVEQTHRYSWYEHKGKKFGFDRTIVIFRNGVMMEFITDYCDLLHDGTESLFIAEVAALISLQKRRQRKEPREINLVIQGSKSLRLKAMEIKRSKLDLDLYYEDDFKETDQLIRKRLGKKNDKGIVLLHGLPGTGKTTYLRYLVGAISKKVLFISPAVAVKLMNPEFIELLIDNPDTVVIIEDAENIILDRRLNAGSAVSNLLNISDGLLSDFLNVQLICTFNSAISSVDSALLRKGRLIAQYEFRKLSVAKAQKLSRQLGYDQPIEKPMTIAELCNPNEKSTDAVQQGQIGFRRAQLQVN